MVPTAFALGDNSCFPTGIFPNLQSNGIGVFVFLFDGSRYLTEVGQLVPARLHGACPTHSMALARPVH